MMILPSFSYFALYFSLKFVSYRLVIILLMDAAADDDDDDDDVDM